MVCHARRSEVINFLVLFLFGSLAPRQKRGTSRFVRSVAKVGNDDPFFWEHSGFVWRYNAVTHFLPRVGFNHSHHL